MEKTFKHNGVTVFFEPKGGIRRAELLGVVYTMGFGSRPIEREGMERKAAWQATIESSRAYHGKVIGDFTLDTLEVDGQKMAILTVLHNLDTEVPMYKYYVFPAGNELPTQSRLTWLEGVLEEATAAALEYRTEYDIQLQTQLRKAGIEGTAITALRQSPEGFILAAEKVLQGK